MLLSKNGDKDSTRYSFDRYYMLLAEIKDFNALLNNKTFFDWSVKNKQTNSEEKNLLKCQDKMILLQDVY